MKNPVGMLLQMVGGIMAVVAVASVGPLLNSLIKSTDLFVVDVINWFFFLVAALVGFGIGFALTKMGKE